MQGAETIQITFDPSKTSYDKLLNLFWRAHMIRPRSIARDQTPESNIAPPSFMSMISSLTVAEKSKAQAQKSFSKPIATEITLAGSFRPAPENHQNFCRKNPNYPYVRQMIEPKLEKLGLKKS